MNRKMKIATAISLVAVIALFGTVFALFSDSAEKLTDGTAGTVKMSVSEVVFENPENINPGDNDPSLPEDPNRPEGTSHKLSFTVENIGTKSIRTKHEITLRMENADLEPTVFSILDMEDQEVVKKYYEVDGEFLTQEEYDALEEGFCTAIKYVIASDIFDGVGDNSEKEEVSTVPEEDGIAMTSYTYQLAMNHLAGDEYQGENVDINVSVFAIQYRNTDASEWYKISDTTLEGFTN